MTPHDSDKPLQELKHDPWPGFPRIFAIVFAVAAVWLTAVFVWGSYVGQVAGHGGH